MKITESGCFKSTFGKLAFKTVFPEKNHLEPSRRSNIEPAFPWPWGNAELSQRWFYVRDIKSQQLEKLINWRWFNLEEEYWARKRKIRLESH